MLPNKPIPEPKLPALQSKTMEALIRQWIAKYLTGILFKIETIWLYATAIQTPEDSCPNILGSSQQITEAEAI